MAKKSTLNSNLPRPSRVALSSISAHPNGLAVSKGDTIQNRVFYLDMATGNSDKYYAEVFFVQPSGCQFNFQAQFCSHKRWIPSVAKTKGGEWTEVGPWRACFAVWKRDSKNNKYVAVAKDSTVNADEWMGNNVALNKASSFNKLFVLSGSFPADTDAYSYRFRVRVYDPYNGKHGEWCYSNWIHIQKAPRIANGVFYKGTANNLIYECNIRYGERGGNFVFKNLYNQRGEAILKAPYTAKMVIVKGRTAQSDPPYRSGFIPARCVIPASAIKRLPGKTDQIYMNDSSYFDGNGCVGNAGLTRNLFDVATKKIGGLTYKYVRYGREDIVLGNMRLVLVKDARAYIYAYLYRTASSLDDDIGSATATLKYSYKGKEYTIAPSYTDNRLTRKNLTQAIVCFVFTRCPLNTKLGVVAWCQNEHGSSATVTNAITITDPFWYFQKEGDTRIAAVLQWNVKTSSEASSTYAMNLPYGRSKPFVAYGTGINNRIDIKGEIATKTVHPMINKSYGTREAWENIQTHPGIYLVRGPNSYMIRLAISSVSLSTSADTEILEVSVSGTEVD